MTGSFCTFAEIFGSLEKMKLACPQIDYTFVLSYHVQQLRSRFGAPEDFILRARGLSSRAPVVTLPQAEPLGPKNLLDIFVIAPCTGNTLAKLAAGITDTPVLMAAKGHLRNGKPLLVLLASNDALGLNLKNIGTLLGTKNIYFVPFRQDAPESKPNSLVASTALLAPALEAALEGRQLQPVIAA
jgi:dipicolinate synthase subunit B